MGNWWRTIGGIALATVLTTMASPAFADATLTPNDGADGNLTGASVAPTDYRVPADVQAQARAKELGRAKWWTYDESDMAALNRMRTSRRSAPTVATKQLAVNQHGQQKNYYCGPAAGRSILGLVSPGPSNFDGTAQTQTGIANGNHMRTDVNGLTAWSSGLFRVGLNKWWNGQANGFFVDTAAPSTSQFRNVLGNDIQHNGVPFGSSTVEFAGGAHYNGHPGNQTIGHWITAKGFSGYGDNTSFVDPATTVWSTVSPAFTASTNPFVNTYLQSNGITW